MNKRFNLFGLIIVCFVAVNASITIAAPAGHSNLGREYLAGTQNLGKWSCGLYYMSYERKVTLSPPLSPYVQPMKSDKFLGYVGYDVCRWITAYALLGSAQTRVGWGEDQSPKGEYGMGLLFNILDIEIEDASFMEDKLRLNGNMQYTKCSATYASDGRTGLDWNDFSGSLTLSLVNDLDGDKFFFPNSIALFAGPAFSVINSSDISPKDTFGYVIGTDLFINEKVSLEAAYTMFDKGSFSFGVNVRF